MRTMIVGLMAAGWLTLVACGSDCNQDCQQCRDAVAATEGICDAGCAGDAQCLEICSQSSCQQNDICDGELDDNCN